MSRVVELTLSRSMWLTYSSLGDVQRDDIVIFANDADQGMVVMGRVRVVCHDGRLGVDLFDLRESDPQGVRADEWEFIHFTKVGIVWLSYGHRRDRFISALAKGSPADAFKAAGEWGIPVESISILRVGTMETTLQIDGKEHDRVLQWFGREGADQAPFAPGTLLHWTWRDAR